MSKIKNGGLDQYGAGPFEQQQFATAGVEGVNYFILSTFSFCLISSLRRALDRHANSECSALFRGSGLGSISSMDTGDAGALN